MQPIRTVRAGFTLIEALFTIALTVLVFTVIYTAIQASMRLSADSATRLAAMSLATERMEYFRSLPYNEVGTLFGFPAGVIPQNRTVTLNNVTFYERVLVDYIDDPADGSAGADENIIITDYKQLKMEISWSAHGATSSVSFVSNIVPVAVETNEGGGVAQVLVADADGIPVESAEVRVTNDTLDPVIDITRETNAAGIAMIVLPAGSNYHASATKSGYSIDKTHRPTPTNLNPSPGSFTVVEALISDQAFQIGELSDVLVLTYADIVEASSTVDFVTSSNVASSSGVVIGGGEVVLEEVSGVYESSGTAVLKQITPPSIEGWSSAVVVADAPVGSEYRVRFYSGTTTTYELVDNSDLPGNATGFTDRIIDLSSLDPMVYPDLTVEISLLSDTTVTPSVDDVAVYYRVSETVRSNVNFNIRGDKTIGTSPDVYKYQAAFSTDSNGEALLSDVEFDDDMLVANSDGLTLTRACANVPLDRSQIDLLFEHQAGHDSELELVLEATPAHTFLVFVETNTGDPLPGALVTLSRGGFTATATTDSCGQVFIGTTDGAQTDYDVSVTRTGYDDYTADTYEINGSTRLRAVLSEN